MHYPDLLLVLAPRHLERVETVVRHVQAHDCRAVRRSQCENVQAADLAGATVIVLDTMGELATLYSLCTVAFIGGSLVPIGGHNALEPAVFAKPLLFGPYMHHFPELAALLQQAGGAVQVHGEEELYERLVYLLTHPEAGNTMGQCALAALAANRGALERTSTALKTLLSTTRPIVDVHEGISVQTILMGGLRWRQTLYTSMWGARAPSVWLQVGLAPLWLASQCYRGLARGHLASYTWGVRRQRQLPCAVVSIGNLTLGGTGKTPLTMWVARWYQQQGLACGRTEPWLWGSPCSALTCRVVRPWSSPRLAGSRR